jgi:hypothetical protein
VEKPRSLVRPCLFPYKFTLILYLQGLQGCTSAGSRHRMAGTRNTTRSLLYVSWRWLMNGIVNLKARDFTWLFGFAVSGQMRQSHDETLQPSYPSYASAQFEHYRAARLKREAVRPGAVVNTRKSVRPTLQRISHIIQRHVTTQLPQNTARRSCLLPHFPHRSNTNDLPANNLQGLPRKR